MFREICNQAARSNARENGQISRATTLGLPKLTEPPAAPACLARTPEKRKNSRRFRVHIALDLSLPGMAPWTIHDLRRTCATGMAELAVPPHIIEAVLNHVSGHKAGVAGIYNRARYEGEMRAALERWADHIAKLVSSPGLAVAAAQQPCLYRDGAFS